VYIGVDSNDGTLEAHPSCATSASPASKATVEIICSSSPEVFRWSPIWPRTGGECPLEFGRPKNFFTEPGKQNLRPFSTNRSSSLFNPFRPHTDVPPSAGVEDRSPPWRE